MHFNLLLSSQEYLTSQLVDCWMAEGTPPAVQIDRLVDASTLVLSRTGLVSIYLMLLSLSTIDDDAS